MVTKWLFAAPVAGAVAVGVAAGIGAYKLIGTPEAAKHDVKAAVNLPMARAVLFNSRRRLLLTQRRN